MSLRILAPDGINFEKDSLTSISVPLADGGWIGIKPGHAPLVAETVRGAVRFRSEVEEYNIELHPGVLEIRDNTVIILTAGEVFKDAGFIAKPAQIEFKRVMQTLGRNNNPEEITKNLTDRDG
ncbi:MAG: F0F1 ATP synthase subunit epsilon [Brevefilum sp.]